MPHRAAHPKRKQPAQRATVYTRSKSGKFSMHETTLAQATRHRLNLTISVPKKKRGRAKLGQLFH